MSDKKITTALADLSQSPVSFTITPGDLVDKLKNSPPAPAPLPPPAPIVPPIATIREEAQARTTSGQRRINLLWEVTQSIIALFVVISGVVVNGLLVRAIVVQGSEVSVTQLAVMSISLGFINLTVGIVIGFYFSRTNHAAIGGVGSKPETAYEGR